MNTPNPAVPMDDFEHDAVADNLASLVRHMKQCRQASGRWSNLRAQVEFAHAMVSPRLVTFGAVAALCCLALASIA